LARILIYTDSNITRSFIRLELKILTLDYDNLHKEGFIFVIHEEEERIVFVKQLYEVRNIRSGRQKT